MKYAKLIDNKLQYAPNPIIVDDRQIGNPPPETLMEQGYKPVIYTDPPVVEPGYIAVPGWEDDGDEIVQTWTVELAPVSEEEALVRFSNELTGAEDETIAEATETLIKNIMEEN